MEGSKTVKRVIGSGIGRIFSRSLNEAFSSKKTSSSDQVLQACPATAALEGSGSSARRRSVDKRSRSSEGKVEADTTDLIPADKRSSSSEGKLEADTTDLIPADSCPTNQVSSDVLTVDVDISSDPRETTSTELLTADCSLEALESGIDFRAEAEIIKDFPEVKCEHSLETPVVLEVNEDKPGEMNPDEGMAASMDALFIKEKAVAGERSQADDAVEASVADGDGAAATASAKSPADPVKLTTSASSVRTDRHLSLNRGRPKAEMSKDSVRRDQRTSTDTKHKEPNRKRNKHRRGSGRKNSTSKSSGDSKSGVSKSKCDTDKAAVGKVVRNVEKVASKHDAARPDHTSSNVGSKSCRNCTPSWLCDKHFSLKKQCDADKAAVGKDVSIVVKVASKHDAARPDGSKSCPNCTLAWLCEKHFLLKRQCDTDKPVVGKVASKHDAARPNQTSSSVGSKSCPNCTPSWLCEKHFLLERRQWENAQVHRKPVAGSRDCPLSRQSNGRSNQDVPRNPSSGRQFEGENRFRGSRPSVPRRHALPPPKYVPPSSKYTPPPRFSRAAVAERERERTRLEERNQAGFCRPVSLSSSDSKAAHVPLQRQTAEKTSTVSTDAKRVNSSSLAETQETGVSGIEYWDSADESTNNDQGCKPAVVDANSADDSKPAEHTTTDNAATAVDLETSVSSVPTAQNLTDGDTHAVSLARKRQANVSTRMRGSSRMMSSLTHNRVLDSKTEIVDSETSFHTTHSDVAQCESFTIAVESSCGNKPPSSVQGISIACDLGKLETDINDNTEKLSAAKESNLLSVAVTETESPDTDRWINGVLIKSKRPCKKETSDKPENDAGVVQQGTENLAPFNQPSKITEQVNTMLTSSKTCPLQMNGSLSPVKRLPPLMSVRVEPSPELVAKLSLLDTVDQGVCVKKVAVVPQESVAPKEPVKPTGPAEEDWDAEAIPVPGDPTAVLFVPAGEVWSGKDSPVRVRNVSASDQDLGEVDTSTETVMDKSADRTFDTAGQSHLLHEMSALCIMPVSSLQDCNGADVKNIAVPGFGLRGRIPPPPGFLPLPRMQEQSVLNQQGSSSVDVHVGTPVGLECDVSGERSVSGLQPHRRYDGLYEASRPPDQLENVSKAHECSETGYRFCSYAQNVTSPNRRWQANSVSGSECSYSPSVISDGHSTSSDLRFADDSQEANSARASGQFTERKEIVCGSKQQHADHQEVQEPVNISVVFSESNKVHTSSEKKPLYTWSPVSLEKSRQQYSPTQNDDHQTQHYIVSAQVSVKSASDNRHCASQNTQEQDSFPDFASEQSHRQIVSLRKASPSDSKASEVVDKTSTCSTAVADSGVFFDHSQFVSQSFSESSSREPVYRRTVCSRQQQQSVECPAAASNDYSNRADKLTVLELGADATKSGFEYSREDFDYLPSDNEVRFRRCSLQQSDFGGSCGSSNDLGADFLSQSDYEDFPPRLGNAKNQNKAQGTQPHAHRDSQQFIAEDYWPKHPGGADPRLPYYHPYFYDASELAYYPPYPTGTVESWLAYKQWYDAWMAYEVAYYGYDAFQEQQQGMGCDEEHHGQEHTFHSQQPGRTPTPTPSKPPTHASPARPPSSLGNPSHGSRREDSPGVQERRSGSCRDVESCGPDGDHDGIRISSHAIQTMDSAHTLLNYVNKSAREATGKPDVSFELIVRMKNDGRSAGSSPEEDADRSQHRGASKRLSFSPPPNENSHSPAPPDSPKYPPPRFWRLNRPPPPPPPPLLPFSGQRFDPRRHLSECPWPLPPFPPSRPPLLPTPGDHFRFATSRFQPRDRAPTAPSSNSGSEDLRDSGSCDNLADHGRQPYVEEWREFGSYPDRNAYLPRGASVPWFAMPPPPPPPPTTASNLPGRPPTPRKKGEVETSSEVGPLDSSFDTRGDYDASGSDFDDDDRNSEAGRNGQRCDAPLFTLFAQAQHQRFLDKYMYKDSGSEEVDSSSLSSPVAPPPASAHREESSPGSYVIPHRRGTSGRGLSTFLQRRPIPKGRGKSPTNGESPDMESVQAGGSLRAGDGGGQFPTPSRRSYSQASAVGDGSGSWWGGGKRADLESLYDEEYPALPGAAPTPASTDYALGGFVSARGKHTPSSSSPSQPSSFRIIKEDGTCKMFFRKRKLCVGDAESLPLSAERPVDRAVSAYSARLMNDNRLYSDSRLSGGVRWGHEAKEAFFKKYDTFYVDTHCHLDFLFNREPYSGTFAAYREKNRDTFPINFDSCVAVFCNPKTFRNESKWKPLVEEDKVWMAMGCHPKSACDYNEWAEDGLRHALKHSKTVALGEIGLDYSKHHGQNAVRQKEVFIRQIKIALEMKLPLVIHCREAEDDCLEILEEHVPSDYKIHCHCFTSNYSSALKWITKFENLYIGLTPLVTFRSATLTHEVARCLPLDKLLLETDAPYFLPCGFDYDKNLSHPGMALMVAIKVAELRGISVDEVLAQVRLNTKRMYNV